MILDKWFKATFLSETIIILLPFSSKFAIYYFACDADTVSFKGFSPDTLNVVELCSKAWRKICGSVTGPFPNGPRHLFNQGLSRGCWKGVFFLVLTCFSCFVLWWLSAGMWALQGTPWFPWDWKYYRVAESGRKHLISKIRCRQLATI